CGSHTPALWHWSAAVQTTGAPVQLPAWQLSPCVHALPSSQVVPSTTAACWQPAAGSQLSVVQALPSSQFGGVPAWQPAAPAQTSAPLQALPSSQSASPGLSAMPSQSLSAPSQSSKPSRWWIERSASPLAVIAFVPNAEATLSNGTSAQVALAVAVRSIVSDAPAGRESTM